jgi:hypothetical protein
MPLVRERAVVLNRSDGKRRRAGRAAQPDRRVSGNLFPVQCVKCSKERLYIRALKE